MKKPDGVIMIAVYYMLSALVFLIGSCAVLFSLVTVVSVVYDPVGAAWAAFGIGVGLFFSLIFLIGSVMAAWGLLALKNWGRWAALVLAVPQLFGFPVFTIIGGLIIYYLVREDVVAAFNGQPPAVEPALPAVPEAVPVEPVDEVVEPAEPSNEEKESAG